MGQRKSNRPYEPLVRTHFRILLLLVILSCSLVSSPLPPQDPSLQSIQTSKNKVLAVTLTTICEFITWPTASRMNDKSTPFIIGFVGKSSFIPYIRENSKALKIKSKQIILRQIQWNGTPPLCHMLLILPPYDKNTNPIVSVTKKNAILTVGELKGLAEQGVHVNFVVIGNRLRFELNVGALREARLKPDLPILDAAVRLIDDPGKKK